MKIHMTAHELKAGLNIIEPAIGSANGLLKLEGIGRRILMCAVSDKGFSIETTLDGEVEEVGTIIVPRQAFAGLKWVPDDSEIVITAVPDHTAIIDYGDYISDCNDQIRLFPLSDWRQPDFGESAEATEVTILADDFLSAINGTRFAVSQKMSRPAYTGVRLQFADGILRAYATDSYRIAFRQVPAECDSNIAITVGADALKILQNLFLKTGEAGASITLKITSNLLVVHDDKTWMSAALIAGGYPDLQQTMSATGPNKLSVDKDTLMNALRMCTPFHNSVEKRVVVKIDLAADRSMHLHTELSEFGTHDASVPCTYTGQDLTLGLCADYLLQALTSMRADDDRVTMWLGDSSTPVQITGEYDDNTHHTLAPVRLN